MCAAPIRVLLIEPHADTRDLYDLGLTAAGFDVVTADEVASALLAFAAHPPHVVVGAVGPRDGGERALLSCWAAARIPVVALTTYPDPALQRAGMTSVLLKPCVPTDLATAIREALATSPL